MEDENLKTEADRLMGIKCRTKGSDFQSLSIYLRKRCGEDSLRKLEDKLGELGYPLSFSKIRLGEWYPEGHNVLTILAAKHLFNWTDKDIFDIGYNSPKLSLGSKIYIKYFISYQKTFESCPQYWRKFMDCGILEAFELDEKNKHCIFRLRDYRFHPIMCHYLAGFFLAVAENGIKSEKITIEETQCLYRNDPCHEYLVKWI